VTILYLVSKHILYNIVAYLLKARTLEPEKKPLLGNSCGTGNNRVTVGNGAFYAIRAEAI
jgi:hypothetical protein